MPKKDKDKKSQGQAQRTEPLPQVWLPDQLEITALSYDKGPRIEAGAEEGADGAAGGGKNLFYGKGFRASFDADGAPPPSKGEQESMAKFWAMEEANAPKGWDDEEELDYTEITSKRKAASATAAQRTDDTEQTDGDPSLFSYAQTSYFTVKLLGHILDVPPQTNAGSTESQISTLETIDTAQRQGRVPWVTSNSDVQVLSLSKYGIKVTDDKKQRVFGRHPLHSIANITYYEDTYSKHMIVLRIGPATPTTSTCNELHIYQCCDEAQAKDICLTLAQAFDAVYNKMKLEQNLHSPKQP